MSKELFLMDKNLKEAYLSWLDELRRIAPQFLNEEYSNPYYACVPKGWNESDVRILLVGEEGFGDWGRGKSEGVAAEDIHLGQTYCWSSLASYLGYDLSYDLYPEAFPFKNQNSPFWSRARKLSQYGICAWTNIDLIHRRSEESCVLTEDERVALHSTEIQILNEQITVLKPTHVIYAGWYGVSLQHELPDIFSKLYPGGLGDNSLWKENVVVLTSETGVYHIFSYHPNWGNMHKGYEARVLEEFIKTI